MSTKYASHESFTTDVIESFGRISGILLPVEVRLGAKTMSIRQLAELTVGHTVSLDCPRGGLLDLFVGNVRLGAVEVIRSEASVSARVASLEVGERH